MSRLEGRLDSLFDALQRGGHLRPLDHALAQALRRLDPDTHDAVLAATALASLAVARGHAAFDPARPHLLVADPAIDWPDAHAWQAQLRDSRWVATPSHAGSAQAGFAQADFAQAGPAEAAPLALEHGLVYLRRYREYERRLAQGLCRIAAHAPEAGDIAALAPLFAALFPHTRGATVDWQARAAAVALLRSLLLVSGGPGTGKTTTITRLLVLLVAQAARAGRPPPRIALAAPTGRAAERMAESLRHATAAVRALPAVDAAWCDALPDSASTLHRLLGTVPGSTGFRFNAELPLPYEVVVVDEASMVDLPLMCKLVEAIADGARLVLLGDPDQLPSVEAGDVLAAIVQSAPDAGPADADAIAAVLAPLLGGGEATNDAVAALTQAPEPAASAGPEPSPPRQLSLALQPEPAAQDDHAAAFTAAAVAGVVDAGGATGGATAARARTTTDTGSVPLAGHRVHLQRGYRQSAALDLEPLAAATRDGDAERALSLLRDGALEGVHFHDGLLDPLAGTTGEALLAPWRALAQERDPAQALQLAARARLLTALRDGPQGASVLNARIEEALAGAQRPAYFHGRLLLVTENSYRHGLFNGDIGVCLRSPDGDGGTVAWFADGGGAVRGFHPAALPAHTGAFAMTVHKAQGSEFDSVWLLLPRQDARALSRELVYTGMTRARHALHVCAGDAVLRAALSRHAQRVSGLAGRLRTPA